MTSAGAIWAFTPFESTLDPGYLDQVGCEQVTGVCMTLFF